MTQVVIIVAVGADHSIGRQGDLAFHVSTDLKHFKSLTMGWPIVMGRKTFESLPKGALPGRRNIVITSNAAYSAPNIEVVPSLEAALSLVSDAEKVFILGGASVYKQALPTADTLELTRIDAVCPDADTFFPELGGEWREVSATEPAVDERSGLKYSFITMRKCLEIK